MLGILRARREILSPPLMGTTHAAGSGRASEIDDISLILAKSINSQLGVCGGKFSVTEFALCLSPYVEYASAWLEKFTRFRIAGALPGTSLNIPALCRFSAKKSKLWKGK